MRTFSSTCLVLYLSSLAACDGSSGVPMNLCVLASTCTFDDGTHVGVGDTCNSLTLLESMSSAGQGTDARLARANLGCLKKATSCDDIFSCLKASEDEEAVCAEADGDQRCSGDVLVECEDDLDATPDAFDCKAAGLVCGELDGDAACGLAACDPDTDAPYCDGDLLVECDGAGVLVSQDCGFYLGLSCTLESCQTRAGGVCGTDPQGVIACVGDGEACDRDTFENRCDGTVMVTCNRGKESRLDCKALHPDLTCRIDTDNGMAECQPAKNECRIDGDDSCQEGVITTCMMGEITEVDCTRHGHTGCATTREGTRTIAYCVP